MKGWETKPLAELCDIKHGFAFKGEFFTDKGDYVVLTPGNYYEAGGYRDRGEKQKYYAGEIPPDYIMQEGDLLVAMTEQAAGLLGSALLVPESNRFLHNQRLGLVIAKPGVPWSNEFYFHVFNTPSVRKAIHDSASGVKVRHTSPTKIGEVMVPVPPLAEQQRIVGVLDEAMAGIATARTHAETNLQNARALFESHLHAVFTQRGPGWVEKLLGEVCEVKDGTHDSPKYVEVGIPFVTQKNIREDGLSFEKTKFINQADHNSFCRRSNVSLGDILISMIGANRGMACLVDDDRIFSIKNVGLVKHSSAMNQSYLLHFLKSPQAARYVRAVSKGGAQEFVGLTELRKWPIPIPPLQTQTKLATQLDTLSAETQRLAALYQQKLAALEELKKSLLHQAFSGAL